jgi:excinuclease UvrABC nuclease subunit
MKHNLLNWNVLSTTHGKNHALPTHSGIYAYAEIRRVNGLPVSCNWIYVGKSLNLRRRITKGHDYRYETNLQLRDWLKGLKKQDVELWFCQVQPEDLDTVELQLVSAIKPKYNKQLKKERKL